MTLKIVRVIILDMQFSHIDALLFGVKGESFIIVKKMPLLTKSSIDFDVLLSVFNRHFSHPYNRADTFVVF